MGASPGSRRPPRGYYNRLLQQRGGAWGPWTDVDFADLSTAQILLLAFVLCAALAGVVYGGKTYYRHLLVQNVLETPIKEPLTGSLKLNLQQHAADEMLLRLVVEECAKREDSIIYLDSQRRMVVASSVNPQHCPLVDIIISGNKRGIGSCTDVALYAIHAGGRIIPAPTDGAAYDSHCGAQTARFFQDTIYPQAISRNKDVLHIQLVSPNMWWKADAALHAKMQVLLCKTQHCTSMLREHVVNHGYWGSVWFMGHTSSDPTVGTSGDVLAQVKSSISPGHPKGFAIHVRGGSNRKQTKAVLDCWSHHPEFPTLVVVGTPAKQELSPAASSAANVIYYPPLPAAATTASSSSSSGAVVPSTQAASTIDGAKIRNLAAAASIHLCPSQSEAFGHYINEARAAGGLIVTTKHAPMSEMVTADFGLLVPTVLTDSDEGMALAEITNLNGHVTAEGFCQAVQQALALSAEEAARKRAAAAAAYATDTAAWLHRVGQLRAFLQQRSAEAAGTDTVSALTEAAGTSIAEASDSIAAHAAVGRKGGMG